MGNSNVTTTTVETVTINSNDIDNRNLHNVSHIKINDVDYNDDDNNYNEKQKEELLLSDNEVHTNNRLNGKIFHRASVTQSPQSLNTVQEINDETDENSITQSKAPLLSSAFYDKTSSVAMPSVDYDSQNETDSHIGDSKIMISEEISDTDEILQELNLLINETNENDFHKSGFYRKRGQSWSNWDTNGIGSGELKAESSLSTFSRPTSANGKELIKQRTLPSMDSKERPDTIEWLAKQNGIDIGNTPDINKSIDEQLFTKSSKNFNVDLSSPDELIKNKEVNYDEEDEELINLIDKEFIE